MYGNWIINSAKRHKNTIVWYDFNPCRKSSFIFYWIYVI